MRLILYNLELIIELKPGDVLLFPYLLIHYANEDIIGGKSSIIAFIQQIYFIIKHRSINMLIIFKQKT